MKKCGKMCVICPFVKEGKQTRSNKFVWKLNSEASCNSYNIIYMISCEKDSCHQKLNSKQRYIGETERSLKDRICEHLGYIRNTNKSQATICQATAKMTSR